jgi:hypothetical protein
VEIDAYYYEIISVELAYIAQYLYTYDSYYRIYVQTLPVKEEALLASDYQVINVN